MRANSEEIRQILLEFGVSFKQNSKSYILTCNRCRKREKLYIRKNDGIFCCWRCKEIDNYSGKAEFALVELTSLTMQEIRKRLYGEENFEVPSDNQIIFKVQDFFDDDEEVVSSEEVLASIKYTPDIFPLESEFSEPGVKYLESRGVSLQLANKYGVMYSPQKRRVIFPVRYRSELYGWQGRTISDNQEYYDDETDSFVKIHKSQTSLGLKKDKALMFRDNLAVSNHCVICEGPFDAIKADLCGGNIATLGKAVSKAQLEIIRNHGVKKIYLALDPDAASEMRRIYEYFKDLEIYDMRPPAETDLGAMSLEEVKVLFDNAAPIDSSRILVYIKNHYGK